MKKIYLLTFLFSATLISAYAQDSTKHWKSGGMVSLNFSQTSLTNWTAGGQNSFTANGFLNLFSNFKKNKTSWDNNLDIGYGMIRQGKEATRKSDDRIDLSSKYGRHAFKHWYYSGLFNFKTQMAPGYNYPNDSVTISNFMAPGYFIGSIGMDYKPSDVFSLFIGPFTGKITYVGDYTLADAGAFGVEKAEYNAAGAVIKHSSGLRKEFGGYLKALLKKEVIENVTFQSKLELFSNYLHNPQNIDVNWEVLIAMKVNKYITANITTQLIYDDDINISVDSNKDGTQDAFGPRTQFKEVLGVGFSYKF